MASKKFILPGVVDLASARTVARDLLQYVQSAPKPVLSAVSLDRAGVPLLQILVAARRSAEALGKTFMVDAPANGLLARLLSTYGLDPVLCGAPADLVPPAADHPTQRT